MYNMNCLCVLLVNYIASVMYFSLSLILSVFFLLKQIPLSYFNDHLNHIFFTVCKKAR